jgi:hypothetical protein
MSNTGEVTIDLTKVKTVITFTDVVLLVTTGGVGWLLKRLYEHVSDAPAQSIAVQEKNLNALVQEAESRDAAKVIAIVHPDVSIILPRGVRLKRTAEVPGSSDRVEITFPKRPRPRIPDTAEA